MLLSDVEIETAIEIGRLAFDPELQPGAIQAASIDLYLHNTFWKPNPSQGVGIEVTVDPGAARFYDYAEKVELQEIIIKPHDFILGETAEGVSLADDLCGLIEGKSGRARHGLIVHCTAPHIAPGWGMAPPLVPDGPKQPNPKRITLEIVNLGNVNLRLRAGTAIAQLMLMPTGQPAQAGYAGKHAKEGT
jgi:deoxycytidine triphosphate deaminase